MKTWVLNTLSTGLDTIELLLPEVDIEGIIGLSKRPSTDAISGYSHMQDYCKAKDLRFVEVDDYALKNESDKNTLLDLDIDVLIVSGWQRLIPQWLIEHTTHCAIGAHGSPFGITGGRGRSPQNWAFILGEREFSISIFAIDTGVDSGDVIDTSTFTYSQHDNIRTSYYTVCLHVADMIARNLKNGRIVNREFSTQHQPPRYLPARRPEDSSIDWNRTPEQVYDFIRALTRPYPGAFCTFANGKRMKIWSATPYQWQNTGAAPGTVVAKFADATLVVAVNEGHILIQDWEADAPAPNKGEVLDSHDFKKQMKTIIKRHQQQYPELPLAEPILNAAR